MENGRKSVFELSAETQLLAQRLLEIKDDEIIPYPELSKIINRDVQGEGRHLLDSARRRILNDEKIVIDCVVGIGVKKSTSTELIAGSTGSVRRVHNAARKGAKRLLCVRDVDTLPPEERAAHYTNLSVLGALKMFSDTRQRAMLEQNVLAGNIQSQLPAPEMLKMFGKVK